MALQKRTTEDKKDTTIVRASSNHNMSKAKCIAKQK